jgi:colanic acid/amylovoran biosynthesis protein
MKILICMITSMMNRGVDALVASKAAQLAKTFPGSQIDVLTRDVRVNLPLLESRGLQPVEDIFYGRRQKFLDKASFLAPLLLQVGGKFTRKLTETTRLLSTYDLAVFSGGDNISSDYGSPAQYFAPVHRLISAGVPVAYLGQSIGPFRSDEHSASFLSVARHSPLITLRETASYNYVTKDLGLSVEKTHLTADTAFLLEPAPSDLARRMMTSFGIDLARPVIALSVSGGIANFASADRNRHVDALERISRRLLAETNAQVLLIPHVESPDPSNNDLMPADALMRRLDFDPRMRLARGFLTSNEYKAIVAQCEMVIAERMHVAIAGLSSGIATFVIGYSVKGHGIMSDTFGVDSLAEGLVTPLEAFISKPEEDEKIMSVWQNRRTLSDKLRERLPAIKERAAMNFTLLRNIRR